MFVVECWNWFGCGVLVEFIIILVMGGLEEVIFIVFVLGSGLDIFINIFFGFVMQFVNFGQLQDILVMFGFVQIVVSWQMGQILEDVCIDGYQYVMFMYYSLMFVWWWVDLFREFGFKMLLQIFEDVYWFLQWCVECGQGVGMQVFIGCEWCSCWFDYLSYFYVCSDGEFYVSWCEVCYDSVVGWVVLGFVDMMFCYCWIMFGIDMEDLLFIGVVVGVIYGVWDIFYYVQNFFDMLKNIVIGLMLCDVVGLWVGSWMYIFVDVKGMVLFKFSLMQVELFVFMVWLFSDDELSLLWFKEIGMLLVCGDLMSNLCFVVFFCYNLLVV